MTSLAELQSKCQSNILAYMKLLRPNSLFGKHHYLLKELTDDLLAGRVSRVVLSLPPRHSKSYFLSELLPAYWLGHRPTDQIIAASYGSNLAAKFGGTVRANLSSEQHKLVFGEASQPCGTSTSGAQFRTNAGGIYKSTGVGAAITGYGGNAIFCDDLVKSAATADSPVFRDALELYFSQTLYTRLMPNGAMLMIGTKWRDDDILAYVARNFPQWTYINIPALCEEADLATGLTPDPLGRQLGEALWPEFWPAEALQDIRHTIGEASFSALYQCRPTSSKGGTIRISDIQLVSGPPPAHYRLLHKFCFWDTGVSVKTSADYSVGQYWEIYQAENVHKFRMVEYIRQRLDFDSLAAAIAKLGGDSPIAIEHTHSGINLQSHLASTCSRTIDLINARQYGDKMERLQASLPCWRAKSVELLDSDDSQYEECLDELLKAGKTKHDDFLDTTVHSILYAKAWVANQPQQASTAAIHRVARQSSLISFAELGTNKLASLGLSIDRKFRYQ